MRMKQGRRRVKNGVKADQWRPTLSSVTWFHTRRTVGTKMKGKKKESSYDTHQTAWTCAAF